MEYKFTINWELPLAPDQLQTDVAADINERVGFAIHLICAVTQELEKSWPADRYPREATIHVVPRDPSDPEDPAGIYGEDPYDELHGYDPAEALKTFTVLSQAPAWFGEGSAAPVIRLNNRPYVRI